MTQPIAGTSLTPQQQADVRAVVRDYLLRDPTVINEALEALATREANIRRAELETDTRSFSIGPADAPVTIVELFDYRCPYCHTALVWVNRVMATRRDVRVVFREYPILTRQSAEAAQAAMASMRQNRYLAFHRALMGFRGDLTSAQIDTLARGVGLDVARMRRDMNDPQIAAQFGRTMEIASEAGISGTPAFLINGRLVNGFPGEAELDRILREQTQAARNTAP